MNDSCLLNGLHSATCCDPSWESSTSSTGPLLKMPAGCVGFPRPHHLPESHLEKVVLQSIKPPCMQPFVKTYLNLLDFPKNAFKLYMPPAAVSPVVSCIAMASSQPRVSPECLDKSFEVKQTSSWECCCVRPMYLCDGRSRKNYTLVGIIWHVLYYACYSHEQVAEVKMLRKIDSIMDNDTHWLHALQVFRQSTLSNVQDRKT